MVIKMDEIQALKEMYKIVAMGIIGIDEAEGKISDKTFEKTLCDARKKYQVNKVDASKLLDEYGEKPEEINVITKMFNEIYTNLELLNKDDKKIAKMLIEGTNKGILKVEEILNLNLEGKVNDLAKELLELLEFQISAWKHYL